MPASRAAATAAAVERRCAARVSTPGLHAWISGAVSTPAVVKDLSPTGALVTTMLPLPSRNVIIRLMFRGRTLLVRAARVVHRSEHGIGLSFATGEP